MKRILATTVFAATLLLGAWIINFRFATQGASSGVATYETVLDPYDTPLLQGYQAYRDALVGGDTDALIELSKRSDDFLAYRSALTLARSFDLKPAVRLEYYRRAAELRVEEPLARQENREFNLELGATAEAAGQRVVAVEAYASALPHPIAVSALKRLESDTYRRSNLYFQSRLYAEALDALEGQTAPSIEAPAHQRLGEHSEALEAYERWLIEQPENLDALNGRAWSHFYLGNMEIAYSLFEGLPGESSLYGRALILNREGNALAAAELLVATGSPGRLWLASGMLEAKGHDREALDVYLQLASGNSTYADDSAYRALVLARRLGDSQAQVRANEMLPPGSFFALREGSPPVLPDLATLPEVSLPVQDLAIELARLNDFDAAVGELVFALRKAVAANDEAASISLAETLQLIGEFRQSQRAGQHFVSAGSREVRTWRVAYPRAYRDVVTTQASRHDLEPELVWAIMRQESAFYPKAVSVSNAAGLMQVVPSTWDWLAELQKEEPAQRFDPAANVRYGTFYLRWLMDYHDGDEELVITSYNRGQGYIRRLFESPDVAGDKDDFFRDIDALETREYLQRVVVNYRTYQYLYGDEELLALAKGE